MQKIAATWQNFSPRRNLLLLCAVWLGVLVMLPYVLHTFSPEFHAGFTVIRDKDYGNYFSRLERVLTGHPEEADNGITPIGSGIEGMQGGGMEILIATFFGWMGLDAPALSVIVTGVLTPMLFLLFFGLFRVIGFSRRDAFAMVLVYYLVCYSNVVTRVMHPGWSFVPTVAALIVFFLFWKKPRIGTALAAGVLLGILPYLYFFSWMYAWGIVAAAVIISFIGDRKGDAMVQGFPFSAGRTLRLRVEDPRSGRGPALIIVVGIVTLLVAAPFLYGQMQFLSNPIAHEVQVRSDFLFTRGVESVPRTVLLFLQLGFFLLLFRAHRRDWTYRAALAMLAGITLAMHQNFIHGRLLMFSSHFYPQLLLSTLIAAGWVLTRRAWIVPRIAVVAIAFIFLAAGFRDYVIAYQGYRFMVPWAESYRDQNLADAIGYLKRQEQPVVLTDAATGRYVTVWTDGGVVYATHMRFLILPDAEMAERYCVSQMFSQKFPDPRRAVYNQYNEVLDSPEMRSREAQMVTEACTRVRQDPAAYLRKYHIRYVLWNRVQAPEWNVDTAKVPLTEVASGDRWVMWEVRE